MYFLYVIVCVYVCSLFAPTYLSYSWSLYYETGFHLIQVTSGLTRVFCTMKCCFTTYWPIESSENNWFEAWGILDLSDFYAQIVGWSKVFQQHLKPLCFINTDYSFYNFFLDFFPLDCKSLWKNYIVLYALKHDLYVLTFKGCSWKNKK